MSKLVINGCSYTTNWSPSCKLLGDKLGIEQTVNLSLTGSSNDGIFRSTLEYILENNDVEFVILALTFWDRAQAPWGTDRVWVDYSPNGIMRSFENLKYNSDLYEGFIKDRYRYDIGPEYLELLLNNIITFSGWLKSQQIRHVIFSSSGEYNISGNLTKLKYLRSNPCVIDIENWSSNHYMGANGGEGYEKHFPLSGQHYSPESFTILNDFVYNYITEHNI